MRLELTAASVSFGERTVLAGLDLIIEEPGLIAIVGPSGSGKSTLMGVLAGRIKLDGGDRSVTPGEPRVSWVFQTAPALTARTTLENVAVGAWSTGASHEMGLSIGRDVLASLGLEDHLATRVGGLSGGERQRVAIARGIATNSDLMLADEPSAALDRANRDLVATALRRASVDRPVVVATHDPVLAAECDQQLALVDGRLEQAGG